MLRPFQKEGITMQKLTIRKIFQKEETKQYLTIPFEVPLQTQRIEISYNYLRYKQMIIENGTQTEELNIIDLGLFDSNQGLRGWSGSERLSIFISEHAATPGYKRGPLKAGFWALALGIYKVKSSVEVEITIRTYPKVRLWLAGDLHMHTINSDGIYTTEQTIEYCKQANLDYIALTDHNNTEQNKEIGNPEGITVLPGMEYTNYRGHANFFFPTPLSSPSINPLSNSEEEMVQVFTEVKRTGGIIALNHCMDDNCPWNFNFEKSIYDLVEVWNGFMKQSDLLAIDWWHKQLCKGRRLAAIGGSDTHRIELGRSHGTPTTFVHALSRAPEDILEALQEGRSFITATPTSPKLDLSLGSSGIGEEAHYSIGLKGKASIRNTRKGDVLKLIQAKGIAKEWTSMFDGDVHYPFEVEDTRFYRLELYRQTLIALTNPVYLS